MKGASNLGTPKSSAEAIGSFAKSLCEMVDNFKGDFYFFCKEPQKTGEKEIYGEYKREANSCNRDRKERGKSERDKKRIKFTN